VVLVSANLLGQNSLIFLNPSQGKLIKAKEGDILSIRYKGYLGQTEYFKNTLTEIKDSSFVLGVPIFREHGGNLGNGMDQPFQCKEIRYIDVVAFRRAGIGRNVLKSTLTLGVAVGSVLLFDKLYQKNQVSTFAKIGVSIGVGISLNYLINLALPEKPNHKMTDGWQINPLKE
jgi:hypothetical protein